MCFPISDDEILDEPYKKNKIISASAVMQKRNAEIEKNGVVFTHHRSGLDLRLCYVNYFILLAIINMSRRRVE